MPLPTKAFFVQFLAFLENLPTQTVVKPKSSIFSLSKEFSDHEKTIRSKMVVANIEGVQKSGEEI